VVHLDRTVHRLDMVDVVVVVVVALLLHKKIVVASLSKIISHDGSNPCFVFV